MIQSMRKVWKRDQTHQCSQEKMAFMLYWRPSSYNSNIWSLHFLWTFEFIRIFCEVISLVTAQKILLLKLDPLNGHSILINSNIHCAIHKNMPLSPILSQLNPFHTLPPHYFKLCFTNILSSRCPIGSDRRSKFFYAFLTSMMPVP
jgi:hypothetical protein